MAEPQLKEPRESSDIHEYGYINPYARLDKLLAEHREALEPLGVYSALEEWNNLSRRCSNGDKNAREQAHSEGAFLLTAIADALQLASVDSSKIDELDRDTRREINEMLHRTLSNNKLDIAFGGGTTQMKSPAT
jgi:hypothetical protein